MKQNEINIGLRADAGVDRAGDPRRQAVPHPERGGPQFQAGDNGPAGAGVMPRYMVIYSGEFVGNAEGHPANPYPPENSVLTEEEDGRWRRVSGDDLREVYRLLTGNYPLLPVADILFPVPAHKKVRRE